MVSITSYSLKAMSLKLFLSVGMVGIIYVAGTGEEVRNLRVQGLACGSNGNYVLLMTFSSSKRCSELNGGLHSKPVNVIIFGKWVFIDAIKLKTFR